MVESDVWINLSFAGKQHVFPTEDLVEHVIDPIHDCWCAPRHTEEGLVIIHNAADEREHYERTAWFDIPTISNES